MFAALAAAVVLSPAAVTLETWQGHGSSTAAVGDQVQYVHAPFAWVTKYWEQQGKPKPGPTIAFNTSFGIVGQSGLTNAPAHLLFPMSDKGQSAPIRNAAKDFTAVLPLLLGGSALLSNGYRSVFTHRELQSCDLIKFYNVTTASGEGWSTPLLDGSGSIQPITTIHSSDHRTFDVDKSLCAGAGDDSYCCGYFDPAEANALKVVTNPTPCGSLVFKGEIYGFVYPRVDFIYAELAPGERC